MRDRRSRTTLVKVTLIVQQWDDGVALCIPAASARAARFSVGQTVEVSLKKSSVVVRSTGTLTLSLAQKLEAFDLAEHGGEAMVTARVGVELA